LTVAENLFVNRQPMTRGMIDWRALRRQARELLDRWSVGVSENARAGDLRVEARRWSRSRALSYGARFIVLDEPTAQLDGEEIKRPFKRVRELQEPGVTFLFISHHLQEVAEICQAVTMLRDARHIVSAPVADLPMDRLIEAMTSLGIVTAGADQPVSSLSRRQPAEAVMGRALASSPSVLVLMDPTAGVDVGYPVREIV
jgi:simple sugar transport system ATP-binding protein